MGPRKSNTPSREILEELGARVGYVFDMRMTYHRSLDDDEDPHPEDPRRTYWIYSLLDRADLLRLMTRVSFDEADLMQIRRVHRDKYINILQNTALMEKASLIEEQEKYDSVFLCSESFYCARLSAGALIELCVKVSTGILDSGFAIIRPPGHHACRSKAMGFCLLNNVAIATEEILYGRLADRVMIVDWDVHHGNGIQEIFIKNKNVLYCSLHRYDSGEFYPANEEGSLEEVGREMGTGFNINIPWVTSGMGDGDYIYAFKKLIIPVANEFRPNLIIVAAGFDAAVNDPIGECNVTPECYASMTSMLKSVPNSKLVLALEGGYNLDAIANSSLACVKALLDVKWKAGVVPEAAVYNGYATLSETEINGVQTGRSVYNKSWLAMPDWDPEFEVPWSYQSEPSDLGKDVVDQVVRVHRKYWKCLQ
ncbi:Histone deacetylase hda1 [Coemansia sp. RSA 1722]|nr:Histone deacetylase hda1 [Coemansia sp. RSA 1722]